MLNVGEKGTWAKAPNNAMVRLTEGGVAVKRTVARVLHEWSINPCVELDEVTVLAVDVPEHFTGEDIRRLLASLAAENCMVCTANQGRAGTCLRCGRTTG